MQRSLDYWLTAQYRANTPELAQDASPAMDLRNRMRQLTRQWQKRFDVLAQEMAEYFTTKTAERVDGAMRASLKKSGMSVQFKMTAAQNDAMQATIGEQVGLIKSIASEHLSDVEGIVMRSVTTGRDLQQLKSDLLARYDITKKRASLIARDQNNKATATLTRTRQIGLGITKARWLHSAGGKHPRPSHVAFSEGRNGGPFYDIQKGAFIDGEFLLPGQAINCRCLSVSVLPFELDDD